MTQIFLLSPAQCDGQRARLLTSERAAFALAGRLRAGTAELGEVMSFLSGLYFRGKAAYARAFAAPPPGCEGALVISPNEGLVPLTTTMSLERLRAWAEVAIDLREQRYYVEPLLASATLLATRLRPRTQVVLLGSVATDKYTAPLGAVLGRRLCFPASFAGRGDMSRGSIMLRASREGLELAYGAVARAGSSTFTRPLRRRRGRA